MRVLVFDPVPCGEHWGGRASARVCARPPYPITVLRLGRLTAEGSPAEIRANPGMQKAHRGGIA